MASFMRMDHSTLRLQNQKGIYSLCISTLTAGFQHHTFGFSCWCWISYSKNTSKYVSGDMQTASDTHVFLLKVVPRKKVRLSGPEIDLENLSWRVLNESFIFVWLHNVSWGAENTKAAPHAETAIVDGNAPHDRRSVVGIATLEKRVHDRRSVVSIAT
ncbi:hypothetical protein ACSQ67_024206 [Phaseolus vulgaris]